MSKEFMVNTSDIQMLIITLIDSYCTKGAYMNDKKEVYDRLNDMFCEINKLCWEGNNYTVKLLAEA